MLSFLPEWLGQISLDAWIVALVMGSFLLGGVSKGLVGLGMPVVVMAVIAAPLGVQTSLGVILLPAVLSNIWQALDGGAIGRIVARLWPFFLAAFIGVQIGGAVLASSSEALLLGLLGIVLAVYSAFSLASPQLPPPGRHERWMAPTAAFTGGVMFGLVGNFIVPGILYLQALGLKRDLFVQTLGVTFIVISSALATTLASHSLYSTEAAALSVLALPPAFLGMAIGRRLRRYVSETTFRKLFFIALLIVGLQTFLRAVF